MSGLVLAAVTGYLLGTIPSADLAGRAASARRGQRLDVRSLGTGNPGGANALTVLGRGWGIAVIVVDIAKAVAACALGAAVAGGNGAHLAGVAAVVGHCFPVWSRFRGGKGVAASGGQCLATFPAYFPADLLVAVLAVLPRWRSKTFSAVLISSGIWVCAGLFWWLADLPNAWGPHPTAALPIAAAATSAVIVYKFLENRK